jgi:inorganic pyrophosphatase
MPCAGVAAISAAAEGPDGERNVAWRGLRVMRMSCDGAHDSAMRDPLTLPIHQDGLTLAVIETPSGSGNKIKYDAALGTYRLDRVLPAGLTFPFDFGFIPETLAADGDPLDVLVLLNAPVDTGTVVPVRLIGVIEAEQKDQGAKWERNDRLVAAPGGTKGHAALHDLADVGDFRLEAIESFFSDYHRPEGTKFRPIARRGPKAAEALIRKAHKAYVEKVAAG